MPSTPVKTVARRSLLQSRRVQLGGGIVCAVALPIALIFYVSAELSPYVVWISAGGSLCAVLLGFYMFRSLTVFPGARAAAYILPSFSISYAVVLAFYWALRLDYSRSLFIGGFCLSIVWHYLIFFLAQRTRFLRIGIVPYGAVDRLREIGQIEWRPLSSTRPAKRPKYDAIVADFRADLSAEWERFLADSALCAIPVYHVKHLQESLTGKVAIDHLSENNFGSLIPALMYVRLKRIVDLLVAIPAAVFCLPFLLAIGIAVRLESPGPAFFRQQRVGAAGTSFEMIKFRTMTHDSEGDNGDPELSRAMTRKDDPRVTRLGRFLRRSRIDELPQIWNILKGEMSWIGPRPEAEVLSRWYEKELPFYRYRHIVKPGLTGWAQVNQGHVSEVEDVLTKLQYDFYYIRNFSPWLDVLIFLKTVGTTLTGFGSR